MKDRCLCSKNKWIRFFLIVISVIGIPSYADTFSFASIIRFPPADNADAQYKDLICTDRDKANIYEIITTMAENGKLSLLLSHNHLK